MRPRHDAQVLVLVALLGMPSGLGWAADESQQVTTPAPAHAPTKLEGRGGVSSPLTNVWHALTDADRETAPPPPPPPGKHAKPQPLTLRDYLNAQDRAHAGEAESLLQYGF